ncbi:mitochondrial ribosomal protein L37-domain-containing protein [Cladochytrium replicatum]|nr:mitochondrial ribosomal protein L37-domain-containing protein [Cladochytrium replicatum]
MVPISSVSRLFCPLAARSQCCSAASVLIPSSQRIANQTRFQSTAPTQPAETETTKESQSRPPSSVAAGTILQNINIMKDGADPVALPDEQYPEWLWDLIDKKDLSKRRFNTSAADDADGLVALEEKFTRSYMRRLTRQKIKLNALKKK